MNNDYFYLIGISFIPIILFIALRKKNDVSKEWRELQGYLDNHFEIKFFIKNNLYNLIISALFYSWLAYGAVASDDKSMFIAFIAYFLLTYCYARFTTCEDEKYKIETISYLLGALILSFIIHRHFYLI